MYVCVAVVTVTNVVVVNVVAIVVTYRDTRFVLKAEDTSIKVTVFPLTHNDMHFLQYFKLTMHRPIITSFSPSPVFGYDAYPEIKNSNAL